MELVGGELTLGLGLRRMAIDKKHVEGLSH